VAFLERSKYLVEQTVICPAQMLRPRKEAKVPRISFAHRELQHDNADVSKAGGF
jgi:hypothetical protein